MLFSENVRFVLDSRGRPYSQPSAHGPGSDPGVEPTLGSCEPELTKGLEPPTTCLQRRCSTIELRQQSYTEWSYRDSNPDFSDANAASSHWTIAPNLPPISDGGGPVLPLLVDVGSSPARPTQRRAAKNQRRELTELTPHGYLLSKAASYGARVYLIRPCISPRARARRPGALL